MKSNNASLLFSTGLLEITDQSEQSVNDGWGQGGGGGVVDVLSTLEQRFGTYVATQNCNRGCKSDEIKAFPFIDHDMLG